jgi:aryl-alcohol dehydrogenase-like predicted oxidoreductase
MQYRELGRTGRRLSVIGFDGMLVCEESQADANRLVASAVERGVNYFDVAPTYRDGEAEEKLGQALAPYRQDVFLACKTLRREAVGTRQHLVESLGRLRTDHFDLYQIHGVGSVGDVEAVFAPGGAMEVLLETREQEKILSPTGDGSNSPADQ